MGRFFSYFVILLHVLFLVLFLVCVWWLFGLQSGCVGLDAGFDTRKKEKRER